MASVRSGALRVVGDDLDHVAQRHAILSDVGGIGACGRGRIAFDQAITGRQIAHLLERGGERIAAAAGTVAAGRRPAPGVGVGGGARRRALLGGGAGAVTPTVGRGAWPCATSAVKPPASAIDNPIQALVPRLHDLRPAFPRRRNMADKLPDRVVSEGRTSDDRDPFEIGGYFRQRSVPISISSRVPNAECRLAASVNVASS